MTHNKFGTSRRAATTPGRPRRPSRARKSFCRVRKGSPSKRRRPRTPRRQSRSQTRVKLRGGVFTKQEMAEILQRERDKASLESLESARDAAARRFDDALNNERAELAQIAEALHVSGVAANNQAAAERAQAAREMKVNKDRRAAEERRLLQAEAEAEDDAQRLRRKSAAAVAAAAVVAGAGIATLGLRRAGADQTGEDDAREQEARQQREQEARQQREQEARQQREQKARQQREQEARQQREQEARQQREQEARQQREQEARQQRQQEAGQSDEETSEDDTRSEKAQQAREKYEKIKREREARAAEQERQKQQREADTKAEEKENKEFVELKQLWKKFAGDTGPPLDRKELCCTGNDRSGSVKVDALSTLCFNTTATPDTNQIKSNFRRCSVLVHPDKLPPNKRNKDKFFQRIGAAQELLKKSTR